MASDYDENQYLTGMQNAVRRQSMRNQNLSEPQSDTESQGVEEAQPNIPIAQSTSQPYSAQGTTTRESISGRIVSATIDASYRRNAFRKIYEGIRYGQRTSDTLNTIILRTNQGDVHCLIYGTIRGGTGQLQTGMPIVAYGEYNQNGEFITREIRSNGIPLQIQFEVGDVLYYLAPFLVALAIGLAIWGVHAAQGIGTRILSSRMLLLGVIIFLASMAILMRVMRRIYMRYRSKLRIALFESIIITIIFLLIF